MSSAAIATSIDEFCASVRSLVAPDQLRTSDLSAFEIDGMVPDAAVEPATIGELQAVLSEAHSSKVTVIPIGGGTHRGAGNVPTSYDVALSLARLNRVLAYEPADLTVTVEPGLRLADLQATLGARGQFLPLDPPCDAGATVGGVLAVNASGPLRHAFGTARDWVIGMRVVHADGSSSKSGGRVVKNVTGYDMHKLHIGALGTLGVIAEVTLKVAPLPPAESTVVITCRSAAHASDLVLAAHDAGLALYCAELLSPPASQAVLGRSAWCVVARVAGAKAAVDRSLREINGASSSTGASVETRDTTTTWEAWSSALRPGPALVARERPAVECARCRAGARSAARGRRSTRLGDRDGRHHPREPPAGAQRASACARGCRTRSRIALRRRRCRGGGAAAAQARDRCVRPAARRFRDHEAPQARVRSAPDAFARPVRRQVVMTHGTGESMSPLAALRDDISRCVHCGFCLQACPTYLELGMETDSPRGRIALIDAVASGSARATPALLGHLDLCLQCRACETACPSGVAFGRIMEEGRAMAVESSARPPSWALRIAAMRLVLPHPGRVRALMTSLRLYQRSPVHALIRRTGVLGRISRSLDDAERSMPVVPSAPVHFARTAARADEGGSDAHRAASCLTCIRGRTRPQCAC